MNKKSPLLSICIPTWNRADFLRQSLSLFQEQLQNVDKESVELYVSDNCSSDNTQKVVNEFIKNGLPVTYNRNEKNLGGTRNFIKCIQWASGQYIWLLGDDDFLEPYMLNYLLDVLITGDYGLVHLKMESNKNEFQVFDNHSEFLKEMSYWSTFISGNIFTRDYVKEIGDPEQYINSCLLQVPYFLRSALKKEKNVVIYQSILKAGVDASNNGGYNFFEVFTHQYLSIWYSFVNEGLMTKTMYNFEKREIFQKFIRQYIYQLIEKKENLNTDEQSDLKEGLGFKGFKIDNWFGILFKYYKNEIYFWKYMAKFVYRNFKKRIL